MRVVSLACSNTEIVCALGAADRLVGVDDHSDFPPDVVERLPRVGPDLSIDVERVAALDPDLVLATLTVPGHEKVVASLEAAGLPFLAPEPTSLEDVERDILEIGQALGVPERAQTVVEEMRRRLRPKTPTVSRDRRPKILVEWWPRPVIVPGRRSWTHDLIERAGGRNVLEEEVKSRPLEDDEVVALDPDAFVLSWCGVEPEKVRPEVIYENSAFAELRAVRERRVYLVPEALLGRPSPRLLEGYDALSEIVAGLGETGAAPDSAPVAADGRSVPASS